MQIKHRKVLACLAMLAFCFSFLAMPVAPAAASSTYTALTVPTATNNDTTPQALGKVQIDIPNVAALSGTYDIVTVSLPSGIEMPNFTAGAQVNVADVEVTVPKFISSGSVNPLWGNTNAENKAVIPSLVRATSKNSFDIKVDTAVVAANTNAGSATAGVIVVDFKGLIVKGQSGDVTATFMAPSGSGFTSGAVVIAKVTSGGGTMAAVKSVKSVSRGGTSPLDTIMIIETVKGTFKKDTNIELKLPSGFEWKAAGTITGSWGWDGTNQLTGHFSVDGIGTSKLIVKILKDYPAETTGRINLGAEGFTFPQIYVPDSASLGDVSVDVSGNNDISDSTVVVAKVAEYSLTVSEDAKKEIKAGRIDQKLGSFIIEEGIPGSLIQNRTIKLTLPDGVKWISAPTLEVMAGANVLDAPVFIGTDKRTYSYNINNTTSGTAAKYKFKDGKVEVSPKFSGPVTITVGGNAGLSGEVTVAEAKTAVTFAPESVKDIILGLPSQPIADLYITENYKGALMDTTDCKTLTIELDSGYTFSSKPTVSVVEGNLEIDSYKLGTTDDQLVITIKSSSSTPAKIKISDVKLTALRYVPEGGIKATLKSGKSALDETTLWDTRESAGSAVIANCVTPAPIEQGRSAVFYIGSTVMNVNGSNVIMDAAPYIKAGRTYVPVRYLGDALGATTAWDAATKTVTVTKEDKTVILVIGSKIAKVNGADVTMDVAPEITNGRTMLPARYVAEGLGYQVGWNATLQQVIIQ